MRHAPDNAQVQAADVLGPPSSAKPAFGQAVGFLLSQLGLIVARQFGEAISAVGLEPRHFVVLNAVARAAGRSQNALAELLAIPTSSMVALIDHLEAASLVERRVAPGDRRTRTLHLTEVGKGVLEQAIAIATGYERSLCEGLSTTERSQLMELLARIAKNVGASPGVHPEMGSTHRSAGCVP